VFTFDSSKLADDDHVIRVVVEVAGQPLESSVSFTTQPPVAATGGGGLPIVPLAIIAFIALVMGCGGFAFLKLRHRGSDIATISVGQRTIPWAQQIAQKRDAPEMPLLHADEAEIEQESVGDPLGVLISRGGADLGSEYVVGAAPVSIGSAARCGVRIDDPELAAEEARTWVRGGHLMVHRMTRLSVIAADGTSGGWMILEPGDTFTIGDHTFEFRMLDSTPPTPEPDVELEPIPFSPPPPVDSGPVPDVLRDRTHEDAAVSQERTRLADMMPSSELAPSASFDDDE
jgi:hypothetical protein